MKTRTRDRDKATVAEPRRLRTRERRALSTAEEPEHLKLMKRLAKVFYKNNLAKNEHTRLADSARKELLGLMETHKVKKGKTKFKNDENEVIPLEFHTENPDVETIDLKKLKKMVGPEVFYLCVTAAKGKIVAAAGQNVLNAVVKVAVGAGDKQVYISAEK